MPPNHNDANLLYEGSDLMIFFIMNHNKNGNPIPSGSMNVGNTGILTLSKRHADIKVRYKPTGNPASEAYL